MKKRLIRLFPLQNSSLRTFFYLFVTTLSISFFTQCHSMEVIPEPNLSQYTVKSAPVCLKWNWHPFCLESKPNSLIVRSTLNNTTGDYRYFLDYYLDSFDSDIPIGISLKIDGTYYNLKKTQTDYTDTLKITSELTEEVVAKLIATKKTVLLSYSNRKVTLNFDLSSSDTETLQSYVKEVTEKTTSLQKMKIVR